MTHYLPILVMALVAEAATATGAPLDSHGWYDILGWPDFCNESAPTIGGGRYAPVVLTTDGEGGHVLTVICTPGMYHHCSLVYPVNPDQPAAADPLTFFQVVYDADGDKRLVRDRWICGRGGVSVPEDRPGVIAFEQSVGPGGCGLINIYDISERQGPLWPVEVRELSCSLPEVHRRQTAGISYHSPFEWPLVEDFRSLPTMDPFVEEEWPELRGDGRDAGR